MNSDRLRFLITELRRGEFIQSRGLLRRLGSHCALGVACEVYRRHTNDGLWVRKGGHYHFVHLDDSSRRVVRKLAVPSQKVVRWYLHHDRDPDRQLALSRLFTGIWKRNDRGVPFEELAQTIEAFLAEEEMRGSRLPAERRGRPSPPGEQLALPPGGEGFWRGWVESTRSGFPSSTATVPGR